MLFDRSIRRLQPFVLGFCGFSFLAVCAGGYFREHHFLLFFPAAGLLAGLAVDRLSQSAARLRFTAPLGTIPLLLFAGAVASFLYEWRNVFFQLKPEEVYPAVYKVSPFPASVEIGRFLASHTPPQSRIAVLGSEPQLFFYSHRRSATGHVYMYPLTESQPHAEGMQREAIREIENAHPDYVVFVYFKSSWLLQEGAPLLIFEWYEQYKNKKAHLELVAWMQMVSPTVTEYHWSPPEGSEPTGPSTWGGNL
jgi:hypothetical protein